MPIPGVPTLLENIHDNVKLISEKKIMEHGLRILEK